MEAHKFLLDYGEAMVESHKVRKLPDEIKFVPTNSGMAAVLTCYQIYKILSSASN